MNLWLDTLVGEIRERLSPEDEGSVWTLLFDDVHGEPLLASVVDDFMAHADMQLVRNLAHIIDRVGTRAALLAVPRRDGRPSGADRQLWRDLTVLLRDSATELIDLVVVGDTRWWSAREDAAGRPAA